MKIYFCDVKLTFCNVLKTNCNPDPDIEVVHGKMMAFRSLALHLILRELNQYCLHMLISICYYSKAKKFTYSIF